MEKLTFRDPFQKDWLKIRYNQTMQITGIYLIPIRDCIIILYAYGLYNHKIFWIRYLRCIFRKFIICKKMSLKMYRLREHGMLTIYIIIYVWYEIYLRYTLLNYIFQKWHWHWWYFLPMRQCMRILNYMRTVSLIIMYMYVW